MKRIEALLRREIGLDAASIGSPLIERIIRARMKEHGLKKIEDYETRLNDTPGELNALIETVVVTETWFFRDRAPFEALAQLVLRDWFNRPRQQPIRILSIPCSSGEEPYSIAMTLLDAGVAPEHFTIDAADISAHALARAKRAIYGKNSFRAKCLKFRDRHFRHTKDGWALDPAVKRTVRFHRENILNDGFLADHAPYDYIFCRNLLIYFDRATQNRALDKIHRLLTSGGVLFVGSAELPLVTGRGFNNARLPMAFACRKEHAADPAQGYARAEEMELETKESGKPAGELEKSRTEGGKSERQKPAALETARRLADTGRFAEAAAQCEAHMAANGPSAEGYYLLGLLKDALGDPGAAQQYRKALYLEPGHEEALMHLALWLEKSGHPETARTYRRRAERAGQKPKPQPQ